jgi:hypothetical protein
MVAAAPDPALCGRLSSLLEQFERLARKYGVRLSLKRLQELKKLRDAGKIKSSNLPAKLRVEFPEEFAGMTLAAIRARCKKARKGINHVGVPPPEQV